jgi:hypothetical protein
MVAPSAVAHAALATATLRPQRVLRRFVGSSSGRNGSPGGGDGGGMRDATHFRTPTSRPGPGQLDYYAILEVHRHQLDEGELKKSYYRLAKQLHPDAVVHLATSTRQQAEHRFREIGVAYSVLSDPKKRQLYDTFLDLSSIGDADRILHWTKINRPLATISSAQPYATEPPAAPSASAVDAAPIAAAAAPGGNATSSAPPKPKPKVAMPFFRSS